MENEIVSIAEAARILGVSQATIRNWVKLHKIKPMQESPIRFNKNDLLTFASSLENENVLKSRRNKSRISARFIPASYVDSSSPNLGMVKTILENLPGLDEALLFEAKKLMEAAGIPGQISSALSAGISAFTSAAAMNNDLAADQTKSSANYYEHMSSSKDSYVDVYENLPSFELVPGEDSLGLLYLALRNLRDKKSTGSYYTPFYVVDKMIRDLLTGIFLIQDKIANDRDSICDSLNSDCRSIPEGSAESDARERYSLSAAVSHKTILDPACGTGNFLLRLPDSVPLENIYGFDIDPMAVAIARINIAIKYRIRTRDELDIICRNICLYDFLLTDENENTCFDIIIGNPPWGFAFDREQCALLKDRFSTPPVTGRPESFSLFLEQGLRMLSNNGTLSFLLPESVLETEYHRPVRELIINRYEVSSLSYLGDIFDKVQCPSIILTLTNKTVSHCTHKVSVEMFMQKKNDLTLIRSFPAASKRLSPASFQLLTDDAENEILKKIESVPHFTLKGSADFALGIVTGDNKNLLLLTSQGSGEPILRGKDIYKFGISEPEVYIRYEPDNFQQCAPTHIYRAPEKLFYRFIATEPILALDRAGTLSLNSANIIVPHVDGYSAAYIMALLNSDVLSFYYRKRFRSLKVLRSSLEALPIAACTPSEMEEISDLAEKISATPPDKKDEVTENLTHKLNQKIFRLYGISPEDI